METYVERINRYVVEYLEDMSEDRKALYRLNGVDPDDDWRLMWSFETLEGAEDQCEAETTRHNDFCESYGCDPFKAYRVRDLGAPKEIVRQMLF